MPVDTAMELNKWNQFAIFWVDPGTTTGAARGTFVPATSWKATLGFGLWETWEVEGSPAEQAQEIMGEYYDWEAKLLLELGYASERVILGVEDFMLRPEKAHGAGSDEHMLDPLKVIAGMETLALHTSDERWGEPRVVIERQMPHEKSNITSERLKRMGAWVKGSEHRRDAMRHLIARMDPFVL